MWSIGELVVLPDQLVCPVVLVGDGGRTLGDRDYVPVVISVVTAVPVRGQQGRGDS